MSSVANFRSSADSFADLLGRIDAESLNQPWVQPPLESWTVRTLCGHTARAILTVEGYLSRDEPGSVTVPTAEAYYSTVYVTLDADIQSMNTDAERAGQWLGDSPGAKVATAISRTYSLLDSQPPNRLLSIGGMGIPLSEYLRTRVLELLLHSVDIANATGLPYQLPENAVNDTIALVDTATPHSHHGEGRLLEALNQSWPPSRAGGAQT